MKIPTPVSVIILITLVLSTFYNWHRADMLSHQIASFRNDIRTAPTCHAASQRVDQFLKDTGPLIDTEQTRAGIVWGG